MQTALIIDDDRYILSWLQHFFQERGFRTAASGGVVDALNQLSKHSFDIVLTDYNMPDGNGGMVLRQLAEAHQTTVRALMTGALAAVPELDKDLAQHLFEKPNLAAPLQELLESLHSASPGQRATPVQSERFA